MRKSKMALAASALIVANAAASLALAAEPGGSPIFGHAVAKPLTALENKEVIGKGYYSDYYAYYGMYYTNLASQYGLMGYYYQSTSYYYSAYSASLSAASSFYSAYYYLLYRM